MKLDVSAVIEQTAMYMRPVTVAEIAADLGVERHTARRHLDAAVTEGALTRVETRAGHTATYQCQDAPLKSVVWLRGTIDAVSAGLITVERRIRMDGGTVTETDVATIDRLAADLDAAAMVARNLLG